MIDWANLGANALWIFGLAIGLAAFSYAYWESSQEGHNLRLGLQQAPVMRAFHLGGVFFCLGLAATSRTTWEQIAWLVLGGYFLFSIFTFRANKQKPDQPD